MTLGEYRVGIGFNPSGDATVRDLKEMSAAFIDACHRGSQKASDPEVERLWALAMTHMEDAAMWAVKAATKGPMK